MKTIIFSCDICSKEFPAKTYSFLNGQISKIDKELNEHTLPFEGHYCGACTELLLKEIDRLKNESRKDIPMA